MPDFRADSTVGEFGYHDMIDGVWSVFVTFPPDAKAVATTEMGQLSKLHREFEARNCRLMGVSCASKEQHRAWIEAVEEIEDAPCPFRNFRPRGGHRSEAWVSQAGLGDVGPRARARARAVDARYFVRHRQAREGDVAAPDDVRPELL